METEKLDYYNNILKKHLGRYLNEEKQQEYLDYCLDYVKENIVYCTNNNKPTNKVIVELFKRGMANKYAFDHK